MSKYITETNKDFSLIHNETGEIVEFKQVKKVKQEDFILVFLTISDLISQLDGAEIKILIQCWKLSTFSTNVSTEGNLISNDPYFKNKIRESGLDFTDGAINLYISRLCKKDLLLRKGRGRYMLNPKYFFKGTMTDRSKLRMTLETE